MNKDESLIETQHRLEQDEDDAGYKRHERWAIVVATLCAFIVGVCAVIIFRAPK